MAAELREKGMRRWCGGEIQKKKNYALTLLLTKNFWGKQEGAEWLAGGYDVTYKTASCTLCNRAYSQLFP